MKTAKLNALVDLVTLVLLIPTMFSGAVTLWILPSGGGGFRGGTGIITEALFWGLNRQEWRLIHDVVGLVFFFFMAVHIVLHWRYFKNIRTHLQLKQETKSET